MGYEMGGGGGGGGRCTDLQYTVMGDLVLRVAKFFCISLRKSSRTTEEEGTHPLLARTGSGSDVPDASYQAGERERSVSPFTPVRR